MRISALCTAVLTYVVIGHPPPAVAQVDQQRAQEYFKEAQALCERDGGRLWGVSICAPMVIGDARTQTFATSQPPPHAPGPRLIGVVNGPIQCGRQDVGGGQLGHDCQLAGSHARRVVAPRIVPHRPAATSTKRTGGSERTSGCRRWTVLVAPRMARARTGATGKRRSAYPGHSRRAGLPTGSSHAVSR